MHRPPHRGGPRPTARSGWVGVNRKSRRETCHRRRARMNKRRCQRRSRNVPKASAGRDGRVTPRRRRVRDQLALKKAAAPRAACADARSVRPGSVGGGRRRVHSLSAFTRPRLIARTGSAWSLGLVATSLREISGGAVRASCPHRMNRRCAARPPGRASTATTATTNAPQELNGVPVLSGAGIDAFRFFICRRSSRARRYSCNPGSSQQA